MSTEGILPKWTTPLGIDPRGLAFLRVDACTVVGKEDSREATAKVFVSFNLQFCPAPNQNIFSLNQFLSSYSNLFSPLALHILHSTVQYTTINHGKSRPGHQKQAAKTSKSILGPIPIRGSQQPSGPSSPATRPVATGASGSRDPRE